MVRKCWFGEAILSTHLHVGECTESLPASAEDRRLLAGLVAEGLDLAEAVPGVCVTFATP